VLRFFKTFHLKLKWLGQLNFSSAVFNQILPGPSWPKPVEPVSDRSAQVCPRRSVRCSFFQSCSVFFCRAAASGHAESFFWVVRSQPRSSVRARRNYFLAVRSHPRSIFLAVRSHPHSSQPAQIFFGCPVASAQQCQAAQKFFFTVRSHLRGSFFGAWNLCSTPFQNPAQYFSSFYCLKNLLFTAQSRQKFKFFVVFPLTVSGSLTALVRSG
jgi:hypothetical protein